MDFHALPCQVDFDWIWDLGDLDVGVKVAHEVEKTNMDLLCDFEVYFGLTCIILMSKCV